MGFPMAGRSIQMSIASVLFIVILSFANVCNGFYLPGSYLQTYTKGGELTVKVKSLTSIETELPFSYYILPYSHVERTCGVDMHWGTLALNLSEHFDFICKLNRSATLVEDKLCDL